MSMNAGFQVYEAIAGGKDTKGQKRFHALGYWVRVVR
jgi:hypothetical protein